MLRVAQDAAGRRVMVNRKLETKLGGCWELDPESFDELRTNGDKFEIVDKIPFVLRRSKHEHLF